MQNFNKISDKPFLKFILKLILLIACIEIASTAFLSFIPFWYEDALKTIRNNDIKYIFIGSSHVAIAINTKTFQESMGDKDAPRAINLGRGYSTLIEHYWGLKKLAGVRRGALKGTVVFLEAPQGVPDLSRWSGNWSAKENPELLLNAMSAADLIPFWRRSGEDTASKTQIVARKLSKGLQIFGNGIPLLSNVKKYLEHRGAIPETNTELAAIGGILTDNASIINARRSALTNAESEMKNQHSIRPEEIQDLVLKDINDLVRANGGRLILYTMPLCSIQQKPYQTAISRQNRIKIDRLLVDWNIPLLKVDIQTTDQDFPDYYHLRNSRSTEFSHNLAMAYRNLLNNGETRGI